MSCSLCPHLVQEYFERVSDILTTYRPQILKQVEYDKISENLVLRGALRPEEHERIYQCGDSEGQVSQMLVVIQNRMWGLENLIAAFMEEHISHWLTQEMFRAYNEHLVAPLKHQRDNRICQCVRISDSVLYKGWVQALKSLDAWILKTGNLLGFINQSMYSSDNMLAFLSDKLADYTGGDSQSCSRDELAVYGFAPNSSGEVQVAELEEDDINDLISLSETLCIGYPSDKDNEKNQQAQENESKSNTKTISDEAESKPTAVAKKPDEKKVTPRKKSESRPIPSQGLRNRRSFDGTTPSPNSPDSIPDKQKQRDLLSRLSTPKHTKSSQVTAPIKSSPIRLRSISSDTKGPSSPTKQRPRSMELQRHVSTPSPTSLNKTMTTSTSSTRSSSSTTSSNGSSSRSKVEKSTPVAVGGKTTGFVRSKNSVPTSPRARSKVTSTVKPTAVATPTTRKSGQGKVRQEETKEKSSVIENEASDKPMEKPNSEVNATAELISEKQPEATSMGGDTNFPEVSAEMSSLFLCNSFLSSKEQQMKSVGYYHLNFDDVQEEYRKQLSLPISVGKLFFVGKTELKKGNKKTASTDQVGNDVGKPLGLKYFESEYFQCDYSPVYGRYLKAKTDIKKGTLILRDKPLVGGPKALSTAVCIGCHSDSLKAATKFKCKQCNWPICTQRCENSPFHKLECRLFRERKIEPPSEIFSTEYGAIGILRGLLLKLYRPQDWKVFMSLEHNNDIRRTLPVWLENEKYVVQVIRDKWGLKDEFSEEEIFAACGIYEVNGFGVGFFNTFGVLFPKASMIAHDCLPNAAHYENGDDGTLEIHAVLDIPAGAIITMCYDCSLKGTSVRQRQLFKSKYFTCKCQRCLDVTELGTNFSTILCTSNGNCKKGFIMRSSAEEGTWKCNRCPSKLTDEEVDKLISKYQSVVNKSLPNIKSQEEFLQECKGVFHPTHHIPLEVKYNLCMSYGRDDGYKLHEMSQQEAHRKLELCQEVLKILNQLTPGMTVVRGNILYELQAAEVLICRNLLESGKCSKALIKRRIQNALKNLNEAVAIFEICYPMRMLAENAKTTTLLELKGWLNSLK